VVALHHLSDLVDNSHSLVIIVAQAIKEKIGWLCGKICAMLEVRTRRF